MTNSVIKLVQSIEADYGMDSKLWPENDPRLKQLHDWYLNHSEKKKRNLPYTEIHSHDLVPRKASLKSLR